MDIRNYNGKRYFYVFILLFMGLKISFALPPILEETKPQEPQEVWLNVFVHGIMSIKPHISWSNFMRFMKEDIEGTLYEKTVELMRDNPFFYKNQAMQQIGLHRVNPSMTEGNSSASLAYILDELNTHYGLNRTNYYYTFGWSGLLSSKIRYRDAKALFTELEQEVISLRKQNIIPRVRVIGYSHGGNVGLNLGAVRNQEFQKSPLVIDELVLLGTPIIADSDFWINDPIFTKVFHLYSNTDRIQTLDFFSPNRLFSDRVFRPRKNFVLPEKLIQIQLKVTRCKRPVSENPKRFQLSLNFNNPSVVYGRSGLLRDVSPGHAELWFFGWTPMHYRENYPLHPLPTVSFLPVITHHADCIAKSLPAVGHSVVADIRPEHDVIIFRPYNSGAVHSSVRYIPKEKLTHLHGIVKQCKPELYTADMYQAHIDDAVKKAQAIYETSKTKS